MNGEKLKDVCPKCSHYATCETPCILLHREINRRPEVKPFKEQYLHRENIIVLFHQHHEVRFSDLPYLDGEEDKVPDFPDFGPDTWPPIEVTRKRTGVFLDRFFNKMSYEDLAVKYDLPDAKEARTVFARGQVRLMEIIRRMDSEPSRRLAETLRKTGRFSVRLKAFLLNKCFELSPTEVGQVLGIDRMSASKYIKLVSDRLRVGQQLIYFEGEDLEARGATQGEVRRQTEAMRAAQA